MNLNFFQQKGVFSKIWGHPATQHRLYSPNTFYLIAAYYIYNVELFYFSLNMVEDDFHRGGWRPNAVHVRGIANLKSHEIFDYFSAYSPYNIEWLNEDSCK